MITKQQERRLMPLLLQSNPCMLFLHIWKYSAGSMSQSTGPVFSQIPIFVFVFLKENKFMCLVSKLVKNQSLAYTGLLFCNIINIITTTTTQLDAILVSVFFFCLVFFVQVQTCPVVCWFFHLGSVLRQSLFGLVISPNMQMRFIWARKNAQHHQPPTVDTFQKSSFQISSHYLHFPLLYNTITKRSFANG